MRELLEAVEHHQVAGTAAVLARTVELVGFGAAQYDNAMVIGADGSRAGAILRGVSDDELASAVEGVLAGGSPALLDFRIDEAGAEAAGLSCGGRARLLIEPLEIVPELLWTALRAATTVVIATVVDHPRGGPATVVVSEDGRGGTTGDEVLDGQLAALGAELLADPRGGHRSLPLDEGRLLADKLVARTRVVAVGGGEVVEALADVTRSLGWLYEVINEASADHAHPHASAAIEAARRLSAADALVVTTHDPVLGPDVLGAALASRSFFVGALGARATQARRAARLTEMGFTNTDIARIHGPVGLDLGARSPAETALSICAEILAVRAGRTVAALRDSSGPING